MRRSVNRIAARDLRKRLPASDPNPIRVIVRSLIKPNLAGGPPLPFTRTAIHDAMIAAAMADCKKDGRVRRLILEAEADG